MRRTILLLLVSVFISAACNKKATDSFSGVWAGEVAFEENVANPQCSYKGMFTLEVPEPPNQQTGKFTIEVTDVTKSLGANCWNEQKFPTRSVSLEILGQSISWTDSIVKLEGSVLGNDMNINFESCPNQICSDGVRAKGIIGSGKLSR